MAGPVFAAWLGVPLVTLIRGNDFDAAVFSTRRRPILDQAFAALGAGLRGLAGQGRQDRRAAPATRDVRWIPNGIDRSDWELAPSDRARADALARAARSTTGGACSACSAS